MESKVIKIESPERELRERLAECEGLLKDAHWITRALMKLGDDSNLNKAISKYFNKYKGGKDEL